jgi:two-component system sensor histidine kinase MprB
VTLRARLGFATGGSVFVLLAILGGLFVGRVHASALALLTGELRTDALALSHQAVPGSGGTPAPAALDLLDGQDLDAQFVTASGTVVHVGPSGLTLPMVAGAEAVARGARPGFRSTVDVGGLDLEVLTVRARPGVAIAVAAPLQGIDSELRSLELLAVVLALGGGALGGVLGHWMAGRLVGPLEALGSDLDALARRRDLAARVTVRGPDEVGRVASAANTLLSTLEGTQAAQRRLVADVSHELRTPLTALWTNLEVLQRSSALDEDVREELLTDLVSQTRELGVLVSDLMDLAREAPSGEPEVLDLAGVVEEVLARQRGPLAGLSVAATLAPTPVSANRDLLARAVANLVDNARKWSPPGATISVRVESDGEAARLEVADRGPGIPPGDLPYIFERFYRAPAARRLPGSGLGLAIVRQVADWHGGVARAENRPGGGARLVLELPLLPSPAGPERKRETDPGEMR